MGREIQDRIFLLKVEGRAQGITPQMRIGDDVIDLVWHDNHLGIRPLMGCAYVELFTLTTFYSTPGLEPSLDVIFYSPPQMHVFSESHNYDLDYSEPEQDYSYDGYYTGSNSKPLEDKNIVLEHKVPYSQVQSRNVRVTFAGLASDEGLVTVFESTIRGIVESAQIYDGVDMQEQGYITDSE
jgi:hypothetical protein